MEEFFRKPVIPLPNPGEGGPVYSPEQIGNNEVPKDPVIPLPNPGEGGPVYSPDESDMPGNIPNEEEKNENGNTIITTYPKPGSNCQLCTPFTKEYCYLRFLNASSGYDGFSIYWNEQKILPVIQSGDISAYEKVPGASTVISVVGKNGYVYVQKNVDFHNLRTVTIAIIDSLSGLDLLLIEDGYFDGLKNMGCVRVCNLAQRRDAVNLVVGNQYVTFSNVQNKEVTEYKNMWPGKYRYYIANNKYNALPLLSNRNIIFSSELEIVARSSLTIFLFRWNKENLNNLRVLLVQETLP